MATSRTVCVLLLAGLAVPAVAAETDTAGCSVYPLYPFLTLDRFYVYYPMILPVWIPELWEETNGIPGLQRTESSCEGRDPLPRDTCITHTENWGLINCAFNYVTP